MVLFLTDQGCPGCYDISPGLHGPQARVLQRLLPGLKLRARLLTQATATGSDFSKAGAATCWLAVVRLWLWLATRELVMDDMWMDVCALRLCAP